MFSPSDGKTLSWNWKNPHYIQVFLVMGLLFQIAVVLLCSCGPVLSFLVLVIFVPVNIWFLWWEHGLMVALNFYLFIIHFLCFLIYSIPKSIHSHGIVWFELYFILIKRKNILSLSYWGKVCCVEEILLSNSLGNWGWLWSTHLLPSPKYLACWRKLSQGIVAVISLANWGHGGDRSKIVMSSQTVYNHF